MSEVDKTMVIYRELTDDYAFNMGCRLKEAEIVKENLCDAYIKRGVGVIESDIDRTVTVYQLWAISKLADGKYQENLIADYYDASGRRWVTDEVAIDYMILMYWAEVYGKGREERHGKQKQDRVDGRDVESYNRMH